MNWGNSLCNKAFSSYKYLNFKQKTPHQLKSFQIFEEYTVWWKYFVITENLKRLIRVLECFKTNNLIKFLCNYMPLQYPHK